MATDDDKPRTGTGRPSKLEIAHRVGRVRQLLAAGTSIDDAIGWCMDGARPPAENKTWKVERYAARRYVELALAHIDSEDKQGKDRKRARNRALHTQIIQRLMAKDTVPALAAALKGADQLCKIDGSYDVTAGGTGAGSTEPATYEEAVILIEHANATLQLARARGGLPIAAAVKPVIDVGGDVDEDEADLAELADEPNAN